MEGGGLGDGGVGEDGVGGAEGRQVGQQRGHLQGRPQGHLADRKSGGRGETGAEGGDLVKKRKPGSLHTVGKWRDFHSLVVFWLKKKKHFIATINYIQKSE